MEANVDKPKRDQVVIANMTPEEKEVIRKNADKYANGNISKWIRKSAIEHTPIE